MHEIDIIKVIRRRQAKFQTQRRTGTQERLDEVARLIVEEYDSLLAEIEPARFVRRTDESPASPALKAESNNEAAEAEILGDQGQSGG